MNRPPYFLPNINPWWLNQDDLMTGLECDDPSLNIWAGTHGEATWMNRTGAGQRAPLNDDKSTQTDVFKPRWNPARLFALLRKLEAMLRARRVYLYGKRSVRVRRKNIKKIMMKGCADKLGLVVDDGGHWVDVADEDEDQCMVHAESRGWGVQTGEVWTLDDI